MLTNDSGKRRQKIRPHFVLISIIIAIGLYFLIVNVPNLIVNILLSEKFGKYVMDFARKDSGSDLSNPEEMQKYIEKTVNKTEKDLINKYPKLHFFDSFNSQ